MNGKLPRKSSLLLKVTMNSLAENPYLKASLDYRMPYFNILNYIQLELIKRQRRGELSSDQEN